MGKKRRKRDVYIAIMVAEAKGVGLNLSFEELQELTLDDAISTRAANGLDTKTWQEMGEHGWAVVDPYVGYEEANEATRSDEDRVAALKEPGQ